MVHQDLKEYVGKLPELVIKKIEEVCPASKIKKVAKMALEEYEAAKIDPGESVGLVAAQSIGEPGTQMCVDAEEKIILKFKDGIKILKIGEFADKILDSTPYKKKIKGYEFCNLNEKIFVLSLNKEEKTEWKQISKVNKIKSPKNLIKIKTKSGRQITATDFHSFVTRKDNKIVSVAGKALKLGDRIPVIKNLPEHCTDVVRVETFFPNNHIQSGLIHGQRPNAKRLPAEIKLEKLFGWFIGAYLAEGHATHGQVSISNSDDDYIVNARKFIKSIGLDYKEEFNSRGFALGRDFKVSSTLLSTFIKATCRTGSKNKRVPDFAYSAKEDFVSSLIRGYFDGDGNFHTARKLIRASSNSQELTDGIALLLTRFKIFAHKFKDKKGQHWLLIPYKYAPIFLEKIGSDIKDKKRDLKKLAESAKNYWRKYSQDYTDMIGGFGSIFYRLAKQLNYPTKFVNNFTKRQKIGRTALYRYTKKFEDLGVKKKIDISKDLKILRRMFNSDIIWDEIIEINQVKSANGYVYDLTVPDLETFTTFDGVITHNTLNTFHFAGVAEMNVTMGLPRIIEILDGRKTIKTPSMEIFLKSPYNKGKDIREIAMRLKETKVEEIMHEIQINLAELKILCHFNIAKIKDLGLTLSKVADALAKSRVLAKDVKTKTEGDIVVLKLKEEGAINELYKLKEKIKDIPISGLKGITQVLPVKRRDEFLIITAGTNLKKVLELDFVDTTRTISNDIYEIAAVLGIEATRHAIIDEVYKVIEAQGLNIDIRHIMLVADTMTVSGVIKGITRYGVVSEKASVLARASFETPIRHIINAALIGETDNLNSVVENVMLNQAVPVGTGLPGLKVKTTKEK